MSDVVLSKDNAGGGVLDVRRLIVSALLSICMTLQYYPVDNSVIAESFGFFSDNATVLAFGRLLLSFPQKESISLTILICVAVYLLLSMSNCNCKRLSLGSFFLAILLSFSIVFGSILEFSGERLIESLQGMTQFIKIVFGFGSWSFVSYLAIEGITNYSIHIVSISPTMNKRLSMVLKAAPIVLFLCYLPWIIGTFPGLLTVDAATQLKQYYGIPSWATNSVVLLNPSVLVTQHHPVLHTLLLGICYDLGTRFFGSQEFALFIYTLMQFLIVIATISYAISYLDKCGVSTGVRFAALLFCAVLPFFGEYAVLATKDTLFSCALLLFVIKLDQIVSGHNSSLLNRALLCVFGLLFCLLRNGTIVALLLLLALGIFSCILKKVMHESRSRLSGLAPAVLPLGSSVVIYLCITSILFPLMQFTPGSKREMLSIPFQQVAAVVKYHDEDISEEEKRAIDDVLDYDQLSELYDSDISDNVKSTFKVDSTDSEIKQFLSTWLSLFKRHPLTCIEATMRNYYAWLYPSGKNLAKYSNQYSTDWVFQRQLDGVDLEYSIERTGIVGVFADLVDGLLKASETFPPFAIFSFSAVYVWALFISIKVSFERRAPVWFGSLALLMVFLVVLIGPCNGYYFRYVVPLMFAMPFVLPLTFCESPHACFPSSDSERKESNA